MTRKEEEKLYQDAKKEKRLSWCDGEKVRENGFWGKFHTLVGRLRQVSKDAECESGQKKCADGEGQRHIAKAKNIDGN